jgi:acetyltransferase
MRLRRRELDGKMKQFERLFEPRSIAVVGVSHDAGRPGSQAVQALSAYGYAGSIYPVNPRYPAYRGLRCYPSIAAIEGDIDLAVIGVPARGVEEVVEACAQKRVPFAVILSGGFRESGAEGIARQERIVAIARAAGLRIIGPNCLGLVNVHSRVYAAFGSMTRPPTLAKGAVSLVTQSGGFGYSLALVCADAGIGFRNIVATGNEADLGTVELIDALLDDAETRIILAYIEGLTDARALLECGRRALGLGKPIIAWKAGVTEEGARAAASHTASMTGRYDYFRALFAQAGIVEIQEIHEAADCIKAFEARKLPRGRRVAVIGASGGSAIVFADAAERHGLALADFVPHTRERLTAVIPEIGAVDNPVDFTAGFIRQENVDKLRVAVDAVLQDGAVDALCVNLASSSGPACLIGARALSELVPATDKPVLAFIATPRSESGAAAEMLEAASVPVLPSPVRVARTIAMLAAYREALDRATREETLPVPGGGDVLALAAPGSASARVLSELESKRMLADIGIPVTRDVLIRSGEEARVAGLDAPFAVKVVSPDIPHKTEVGGVRLGVAAENVQAAIEEVLSNARRAAPDARLDGVIISEMVSGGFELLAGAVNDPAFGPVIVIGAGGIEAEARADTACRIAPFGEETAREMVDALRCRRILDGIRGRPALDVAAVARSLALLSQYAWRNRHAIAEIDVNPLIVLPHGVIAADALILLREPPARMLSGGVEDAASPRT